MEIFNSFLFLRKFFVNIAHYNSIQGGDMPSVKKEGREGVKCPRSRCGKGMRIVSDNSMQTRLVCVCGAVVTIPKTKKV